MPQSILVTGGAASGKSRFAATHFAPYDNVLYIKTGEELSPDLKQRIDVNNEKYDVTWIINNSNSLTPSELVSDHKFVIFDSISSYTELIMKDMSENSELTPDFMKAVEKRVIDEVFALRDKVAENRGDIIMTTLETGFSVKPENKELAAYREILGKINQRVANTASAVYFSASGIQFQIH